MNFSEEKEIVIVGGGICGLATALALHRKGVDSVVLERADSLRATGAAIGIYTNGWRALDQLGVGSRLRQKAIPIQMVREILVDNNRQQETPIGKEELRCVKRSDLVEILAENLPPETIRFGCQIVAVKLDPLSSDPVLQLYDGTFIKAKVVIGSDGANSVVAGFLGLKATKLLSYCAIRGFTNHPTGHGLNNEFIRTKREGIFQGRIPVDDKLVCWFIGRQWTPEGDTSYTPTSHLFFES